MRDHPLKGEFDPATAKWKRTPTVSGAEGTLEIGYGENGLIGLRLADQPEGVILIYTPEEWDAFLEGVRDGEFDLESMFQDLSAGSQTDR
ncbi:DUF397 domain-containing protein [Glycomyces salinus]|uniref:DUF397 domain-containing protein n=1 Tax=Glycomyces salinus TaxID=980294 RepID=UPI001E5C20CE|nr:DUF397 domain-containing protein [Glycomyces salinus]